LAEIAPYTQEKLDDSVRLVVTAVEHCERDYHDAFVEKVEARYLAYRGLADESPDDDTPPDEDWHSNVTTPYVLNTCEGMLATMLEPNPRFQIKPRPKPDEPLDEVIARLSSVEAISDTLRYALDRDGFAQKQRDFMQQDLIAGISVLKDYWYEERRDVVKLVPQKIVINDAFGNAMEILDSHEEQTAENALVADDARSEVRDVRDFFWPAQAPNVGKAEYLIDRTWVSFDYLKRMEKLGYYSNVDKVKSEASRSALSNITKREMRLRGIDRTKDLHEVLEYWTPERCITVCDRTVELWDRSNPNWNGRMPFVVCSAMPDAFQIPGVSVVEALAQLQSMLWTLQNQRIDVVRLLANVITLIRSDVDDGEAFEWAPNAQWFVEDPGQVQTLQVDPTAAQITLQAEGLLKGDLQNIMGGLPMAAGADSQTIDQQTATGVSIITTIAQRIIQSRKQHYLWAYAELGKHFLMLYQQFLREDRVVPILGKAGADAYRTVSPLELQGDYDLTIDVTGDSLMSQERRASAQSLFQIGVQSQMIMAQSGSALNLKALFERVLDAYDVIDKERYFMPQQIAAAAAVGPPQQGQSPAQPQLVPAPGVNGQGGGGGVGGGVTNTALAAGPMSPNSEVSSSPEAAMAQMLRMRGGAANAPAS
jgi:hypothetical protein